MVDEDKDLEYHPHEEEGTSVHEEEYHYTEEPSMEAFTAATSPVKRPEKKTFFSRRSFLFITAVIIISIAVYQFLGTLQTPKPPAQPTIVPPKPPAPVQPAPAAGLTQEQATALQNRFNQIDTQITALGNQVTGLSASVST